MSAVAVKERPIIMTGESVRAILDGRKTQTRRVVKVQPPGAWAAPGKTACPYGQPGDRLWVREGFRVEFSPAREAYAVAYRVCCTSAWGAAVDADWCGRQRWRAVPGTGERASGWKSPLHMPRWACRLMLKVTEVRVQRVQEVSEDDARAEGVRGNASGSWGCEGLIEDYATLWNSINAHRGYPWDANPWVWAVTFGLITAESGGEAS